MLTIRKATWSSFARSPAGRSPEAPYFYSVRLPAPPGHECPGYASTEKPGEPGSWRSGSDFGAGFSRLFVSNVARAFMPGRGGRSQSDKVVLRTASTDLAERGPFRRRELQQTGPHVSGAPQIPDQAR